MNATEKLPEMTMVLSWCDGGDKEIVDVGLYKVESTSDVISKSLESLSWAPESQWYWELFG